MKQSLRLLCLANLLWLTAGSLFGQGRTQVVTFSLTSNTISFTLQNTASVPDTGLANNFQVQESSDLASWTNISGTTFTPVSGKPGFWSSNALPRPAGAKQFYRIFPIVSTAGDPDGDGLSTAEENALGTDPNLFDTDGDGFSDGAEFAYGSNPLDPTSHPVFDTSRPTVNFVADSTTATEGAGTAMVQIAFNHPYNGTLNYTINSMSNAVAGVDYTTGTSVSVSGTGATIPITLVDDAKASGQRVVIIDLKLNGENYFIGGRSSHVVVLNDNDAWWTGTLAPASGETMGREFRLKIAHQGATTTAEFGAGAGNDGLSVPGTTTKASGTGSTATLAFYGIMTFPVGSAITVSGVVPAGYNGTHSVTASSPGSVSFSSNATGAQTTAGMISSGTTPISNTSISATLFPAGTYTATGVIDTASQFQADSPAVPIPAGAIVNQAIKRKLHLNAQPALNSTSHPHEIIAGVRYVGDYTETLSTPAGVALGTLHGSFILVRDLPAPLPVVSKLVP
jgi:hypothetical protein